MEGFAGVAAGAAADEVEEADSVAGVEVVFEEAEEAAIEAAAEIEGGAEADAAEDEAGAEISEAPGEEVEVGRDSARKTRNQSLQGLVGAVPIAGVQIAVDTDTTRTGAVTTRIPMAGTPTTRRRVAHTAGMEHTTNPTETKTTDLATIAIHTVVGHMAVATIILIQTIGTDFSHSCSFFIQKCDSRSFCYFTTYVGISII